MSEFIWFQKKNEGRYTTLMIETYFKRLDVLMKKDAIKFKSDGQKFAFGRSVAWIKRSLDPKISNEDMFDVVCDNIRCIQKNLKRLRREEGDKRASSYNSYFEENDMAATIHDPDVCY